MVCSWATPRTGRSTSGVFRWTIWRPYNGQKSDILQPATDYASAAAVYLRTRRPEFAAGSDDNLKLSLSGGSFGTVNPAVVWERRLGERLCAQMNAEYLSATGRYRFRSSKLNGYDTTEVRQNGDVEALRIEGGLFGRLSQGDWTTKLYFYDSERGYPGASVRGEPGKFLNTARQWDSNFFVQSSLRHAFGSYSLMLNAKYANDHLRYFGSDGPDDMNGRFRQQEFYFSAAQGYDFSRWLEASFSADVQYNTLDALARPWRRTVLLAAASAVDLGRVKFTGSLLHTMSREKAAAEVNRLSPTLMAFWRVDDHLTVRFFHKNIFRLPTLNDNYYTLVGSAGLKPERTGQYNLGVAWEHRWLTLRADAYYNEVHDKIVALPQSDQFRWTMLNLGYVEVRGIDLSASAVLGIFRARLNYSYEKAQDLTDRASGYYGGLAPYSPLHSGSVVLGAAWRGWDVNYSFIYTGEHYEGSDNTPDNYALPWYTGDMSLSRTLGRWRLTAQINNIFNQQYEVVRNYPMPGTNVKLKIEFTL